ncbi:MAG: TetR/AcrR family transcriptional regulator [Gammaproteobacteria bacterium]|nr:TetR/AcrR family transcriptional regulator [Gammaproteobacteria bacterium]
MARMNPDDAQRPSRDALVEAAAALFREKGYERTTVRDLADAVGMQSGSLFYHFSSKGEILYEVMRRGIDDLSAAVTLELQTCSDPREELITMTRTHLRTLLSNTQASLASLLYEWRSLPSDQRDQVVQLRDKYEDVCRDVMQRAMDQGVVKQGDPKLLVRLWLGAINWSSQWFRGDGELGIDSLAEEVVDMILVKN